MSGIEKIRISGVNPVLPYMLHVPETDIPLAERDKPTSFVSVTRAFDRFEAVLASLSHLPGANA